MLEIMAGLAVLAILAVVLMAAQVQSRQGAEALASQRHAMHVAERALEQLRQGQSPPSRLDDSDLTIDAIPSLSAPQGQRWVWLRCQYRDQRVQIAGLVPQ